MRCYRGDNPSVQAHKGHLMLLQTLPLPKSRDSAHSQSQPSRSSPDPRHLHRGHSQGEVTETASLRMTNRSPQRAHTSQGASVQAPVRTSQGHRSQHDSALTPTTPHNQGDGGGESRSGGKHNTMPSARVRARKGWARGTESQSDGRTPRLTNDCNRPQKSATTDVPMRSTWADGRVHRAASPAITTRCRPKSIADKAARHTTSHTGCTTPAGGRTSHKAARGNTLKASSGGAPIASPILSRKASAT